MILVANSHGISKRVGYRVFNKVREKVKFVIIKANCGVKRSKVIFFAFSLGAFLCRESLFKDHGDIFKTKILITLFTKDQALFYFPHVRFFRFSRYQFDF